MDNSFAPFYSSNGICTDTRKIEKDCLFICIQGENFDGNAFASKALEAGASHVIVDNPTFFLEDAAMTLVEDSVVYLQELANYHRKQFDIPVIGITGSNGKTTSKELINAVLSKKYKILATIGNLNNHLGVPFTLLRLTKEHDIAIIEMGANKFKDIEELCTIAEPTHGIITNIGRAHLEGLINIEGVIKTKKELYEAVEKVNGTIFINSDDEILNKVVPQSTKNITYGENQLADIVGELVSLSPFVEMKWKSNDYSSEKLTMQMIGKYNFYNYLAAIAIGKEFGVSNEAINEALLAYSPENKRSQVVKTAKNTLILDCYNANPTSMQSALESFAVNAASNKICILGDMKEIGPETEQEHQKIVSLLENLDLQAHVVGKEFSRVNSCNILQKFENVEALNDFLTEFPIKSSLILLKGSNSIHLDRLEGNL
ncbi:MAG: UDP-N-acetylmuramoyl-tripeptide--D-alanyl-D-alanine ligase [Fluviicola sp.]|nr:UDP-N-acetylmuramoyl-tripeptide--D-alanyl-D-alanine ligase [Fluviicola sp.]